MDSILPIRGSVFSKLPGRARQDLLLSGAVPVNDVFFDLWDDQSKIILLYGGFGSGKSVFAVDKLIDQCLTASYFRCFYGRKVYDTVRISVFLTLCDRIEELNLKHKFIYSRADNSSMVIRCRDNGNTFTPFGADNPDKLKSVKDLSHILCEELDQFSETDFGILISRLRTEKVNTQFIGLFNTTSVKQGHWIKVAFFGEESKDQDLSKRLSALKTYSVKKLFCNYTDNHFIDREEYEQTLWISAVYNERKFNEISAGEWGAAEVGNPFIFNFDKKKHVRPGLQALPNLPIILSFDFNVSPITCMAGQIDGMEMVRVLDEYRLLNSDIEELCLRILVDYSDRMLLVTGDASGQSRTALKRDLNYYKVIKQVLKLGMGQFKLPAANPPIKNTRVLCNALLKKHPNYLFSDRVPYLILDIEETETDENGLIDESKDKHKGHLFAAWRYFNWTFLNKFLDQRIYDQAASRKFIGFRWI